MIGRVLPYGFEVYVGPTDDEANLWKRVPSLAGQGNAHVYTATFSNGTLTIRFGDSVNGAIPLSKITVFYLAVTPASSGSSGGSSMSSGGPLSSTSSSTSSSISGYWQRLRYCANGQLSPFYVKIIGPAAISKSFRQASTGYCFNAVPTDSPVTSQPLNVLTDLVVMSCGDCLNLIYHLV